VSTSYEEFSSLVWQAQGSAGLMLSWQLDPDTALNLDPQAPGSGRAPPDRPAGDPAPPQHSGRRPRPEHRAEGLQASEAAQHRRAELMHPASASSISDSTPTARATRNPHACSGR
jgi:hypothetical protein